MRRSWPVALSLLVACTSTPPAPAPAASTPVPVPTVSGTAPAPEDASAPVDAAIPVDAAEPLTLTAYPRRGSQADDTSAPKGPGLVMMGGGPDVDAAFVWAHDLVVGSKARGADVVVLRATGADGYDAYLDGLAQFNSVQTLKIPAKATSTDLAFAARVVGAAEIVFFAGGNQGDYVAWAGSPLMRAVQGVYDRGGVVGGTSAGTAILGASVNDATLVISESITSKTMMTDPYDPSVHFTQNMLVFPPLARTITDMHFAERDRMGRLVGFMARQVADGVVAGPLPTVYGVAVDEDTALVIDPARSGRIFRQRGAGAVYVVRGGAPDRAVRGQPLVYRDLTVHKLDSDAARYDFARHCGTGRTFPLTAVGSATSYEYTPSSPYAAQGNVDTCP